MVHKYIPVIGDACGAHLCMGYMYVYMVHIYAHVIGDACSAHAFPVLFTFQVFFMCFSHFSCFTSAFTF